jgi:hypothetical protein
MSDNSSQPPPPPAPISTPTNNNTQDTHISSYAKQPLSSSTVKNANTRNLTSNRKAKILKSHLDEFMNVVVIRRCVVLNPTTGGPMIREFSGTVTDLDIIDRLQGKHHPNVKDDEVIVHVVFDDGDKEDMLLSEFKQWRLEAEQHATTNTTATAGTANHTNNTMFDIPTENRFLSQFILIKDPRVIAHFSNADIPYSVIKQPPSRLQQVLGKYEPQKKEENSYIVDSSTTTVISVPKKKNRKIENSNGIVGEMGGAYPNMVDLIQAKLIEPGNQVLEIFLNDRQGRREGQTFKGLADLLPNGFVVYEGITYADTMAWVGAFKTKASQGEGRIYRDWRCIRYRKYPFPILQDLREKLLATTTTTTTSTTNHTLAINPLTQSTNTNKIGTINPITTGRSFNSSTTTATTNYEGDFGGYYESINNNLPRIGARPKRDQYSYYTHIENRRVRQRLEISSTESCEICHESIQQQQPTTKYSTTTTTTNSLDVLICESCNRAYHATCLDDISLAPHRVPHEYFNTNDNDTVDQKIKLLDSFIWICNDCSSSSNNNQQQVLTRHRRLLNRSIREPNPLLNTMLPEAFETFIRESHLVTPYPCPLLISRPQDIEEDKRLVHLFNQPSPLPTIISTSTSTNFTIDRSQDIALVPFRLAHSKHPTQALSILARAQAVKLQNNSSTTTNEDSRKTVHVEYICPLEDDLELDRTMIIEPFASTPLVDPTKQWLSRFEAITRSSRIGWIINTQKIPLHISFVPPPATSFLSCPASSYVAYFTVAVRDSFMIQLWQCQEQAAPPLFVGGIQVQDIFTSDYKTDLIYMEWCGWRTSVANCENDTLGLLACATKNKLVVLRVPNTITRNETPNIINGKNYIVFEYDTATHKNVDKKIIKAGWRPAMTYLPSRLAICMENSMLIWDPPFDASSTIPVPKYTIITSTPLLDDSNKIIDFCWSWNEENGLVTLHENGECRIWDISDIIRGPILVISTTTPSPSTSNNKDYVVAPPNLGNATSILWLRNTDYFIIGRDSGFISLVQILDGKSLHLPAHFSSITNISPCPRFDPPVFCSTSKDGNCLIWRCRARFTFREGDVNNNNNSSSTGEGEPLTTTANNSTSTDANEIDVSNKNIFMNSTTTTNTTTSTGTTDERIPSRLFSKTGTYSCSLLGRVCLIPGSSSEDRLVTCSVGEATLPSSNDVIIVQDSSSPDTVDGENVLSYQMLQDSNINGNALTLQSIGWGFAGTDLYEEEKDDNDQAQKEEQNNEFHDNVEVQRKRLRHGLVSHRHYEWIAYGCADLGICRLVRIFIDVD